MTAYSEQRYADALEAVRGGLEHVPEHAGLHYNCAPAALERHHGDDTFAHLDGRPFSRGFREDARRDDDFAAVRDDRSFELFAERAGIDLQRPGRVTFPHARASEANRRGRSWWL